MVQPHQVKSERERDVTLLVHSIPNTKRKTKVIPSDVAFQLGSVPI